jgi:hypothetical protein
MVFNLYHMRGVVVGPPAEALVLDHLQSHGIFGLHLLKLILQYPRRLNATTLPRYLSNYLCNAGVMLRLQVLIGQLTATADQVGNINNSPL